MNEHNTIGPALPEGVDKQNLLAGVGVGLFAAVAFGLGGFFLVRDADGWMGFVLFLLLPAVTGFATALVAKRRNVLFASLIIGLIFCTAILLVLGAEGLVCVIMSAPLLAVGLGIGALLGWLFRRSLIDQSRKSGRLTLLTLFVLPFFLMGANSMEKPTRSTPRTETFTSVLVVDSSPEEVWNTIKIMDRVSAHKGFLMRIGLPVPVSCSIDKEQVGGKRRCNFEKGYIEEAITEWNRPNSMKLEITSWDVPGRPWLDFKDASYEFRQENGHTVMTRNTTIRSRLSPAWYWRGLERMGVETEHQYLFEAVTNSLKGRK